MPAPFPPTPLSILLVEDHVDTAESVSRFLTTMGHRVKTAASVEDAVKNVTSQDFDLIISDVGLPDGNGISLIHCIRRFCGTPAIAVTGYCAEEDVERCLKAGFDLHLPKPLNPAKLVEAIERIVSGRGNPPARASPENFRDGPSG